ncbi:zinc transporter ZIP1-like [Anneissia japonica]|uniref:zinc transporter ZIP1-like n=1 Tax=Anneissia japonica TaxID=1529436 RepID=UPI001425779C|nr:zinc transporter ZIP1-like [Anneissia japonica]
MEVLAFKILILVLLFFLCLFFGLLPITLRHKLGKEQSEEQRQKTLRIVSFLSCYGGGVFLATCLLDLLPTVRDRLSLVFDQLQEYTAFPFAEFVMVIGFFLVLIIEQTALMLKETSPSRNSRSQSTLNTPLIADSESYQRSLYTSNSYQRRPSEQAIKDPFNANGVMVQSSPSHGHSHGHSHDVEGDGSSFRSLMLLFALSLHSLFEGLAVGLQNSTALIMQIFIALIIHKNVLAFSLGLNLVKSNLTRGAVFRSCLCFAIMAPIGIGIGIAVDNANDFIHSLVNGILEGIATGTFLYITFFEVLPHEFQEIVKPLDRVLKVLCILLGYATICGLLFIHATVIRPTCYRSAEPVGT